ncbi:predicted protein [Naegleria gruberi]|uniref:pantothenate kinase n=1 Tax=Naegleria gruberi TaxID=5762 RepID=D2VRE7_NAEGR|nr:uncharacterized protein NAEGRDRAFT_71559 [Naegleria gruberi]EFC40595.1 predicted protein [Naegleria gruberi]|eukprot:XP_002673339.1 predicted protein [Naegleria gruberi strain NEG-M]
MLSSSSGADNNNKSSNNNNNNRMDNSTNSNCSNNNNSSNSSNNVGLGGSGSALKGSEEKKKQQAPIKILKKNDFRQDNDEEFSMSPKLVTRGVLSVKIPPANVNSNNGSPLPSYKKSSASPSASSPPASELSKALVSSEDHDGQSPSPTTSSSYEEQGIAENHFIFLPNHNELFNHFALDIGGSLVKMVYMLPFSDNEFIYQTQDSESNELEAYYHQAVSSDDEEVDGQLSIKSLPPQSPLIISKDVDHFYESENGVKKRGSKLCFARFQTQDIEQCLSLIEKLLKLDESITGSSEAPCIKHINATGGGAFKFSALLKNRFGFEVNKLDEMESLIKGLNFLLLNIPNESFTFTKEKKREYLSFHDKLHTDIFPYLIVNIGSGVSIVRVDDVGKFERVSGSSIGGGTFWGLSKLLTGCNSFEELLKLTKTGDNKKVDMLVGDIYGRDYEKIGLNSDIIASSFGKMIQYKAGEGEEPKDADLAKSLLFMICNNIGQIAYLNALRFGLKRIFFAGYFIRNHDVTMHYISYAINFWSRGEISATFLRHEGYLGAIGSFLSSPQKDSENSE